MPPLNTSKNARILSRRLVEGLVSCANDERPTSLYTPDKTLLSTRWVDRETSRPQLIVHAKHLKHLVELVEGTLFEPSDSRLRNLKDRMRNSIRVLEQYLKVLKDSRPKTQGSPEWLFTLTLWSKSVEDNLKHFDSKWESSKGYSSRSPLKAIGFKLPDQTPVFTGREEEIKSLLEYVSPEYRSHMILVCGRPGIGKTSLVLEMAHRCKQAMARPPRNKVPRFDAIIFAKSKENYLAHKDKTYSIEKVHGNMQDIFRAIAQVLDNQTITQSSGKEQIKRTYQCLSRQRTLLIIDNFDNIQGLEGKRLAAFLDNIPPPTKVVITTRQTGNIINHIELKQLNKEHSLILISKEARRKALELSKEEILNIYENYAGIPLALILAVGRKANPSIAINESIRKQVRTNDKVQNSIDQTFFRIRNKYSHKLLMALAIFQKDATRKALSSVSGIIESDDLAEGLRELDQLSLINQREGRYRLLPLMREYALTDLNRAPAFRKDAETRWIKWYLEFAKKYGGKDWSDWDYNRDLLNKEWKNIISVIEYCSHMNDDTFDDISPYEIVLELWFLVSPVASLTGYWSDRLYWLDWIIEASEKRGDIQRTVEAMTDKGYTLALMNHLDYADELLKKAWDISKDLDPIVKTYLAHNRAFTYIRKTEYDKADYWLSQEKKTLENSNFEPRDYKRREAAILYYKADIFFHTGKREQSQKDFKKAKNLYQEVEDRADEIGWLRAKNNAQNRLAEVAIEEEDFLRARELLCIVAPEFDKSEDRWGIASYKASFARLEAMQGNWNESQKWAKEAEDIFHRLGMLREEQEMGKLISH